MREDLLIRRERPEDGRPARGLIDAAFGPPAGAPHAAETVLLDGLRADGDVVAELTFAAVLDGRLAGHVVCSRARLGEGRAVALGPIAVRPDLQRQGVGSALVAAVIATADQRGEPCLVLLGEPAYYARFGFEPAAARGIGSPGPWEDAFFQVLTLRAWRPELAGPFRYAPAFERL
jgi:putative acetyltransferase